MSKRVQASALAAAALAFGPAAAQTPAAPASDNGSPAASAAITALDRVCLPLIQGKPIKAVASAVGMKQTRGEWVMVIEGRQRVVVDPPGGANPTVCTVVITYAPGAETAMIAALDGWAAARTPPLQKDKVREEATGSRKLSSWLGSTPDGNHTIVLAEQKTPTGGPIAAPLEQATLLVNLGKP